MSRKVFFIFLFFLFLALMHLIINAQIMYVGYNIDSIKKDLSNIRSENRDLAASAAQKGNLARIDAAAKKMGMYIPGKVIFITNEGISNGH